jgi:hypothetical protein
MHAKVQLATTTWGPTPVLYLSDRTIEGDVYLYDEPTKTARLVRFESAAEDGIRFAVPDAYKHAWFIVEGQNSVFDGQPVTVVGTYGDQSWD